MNDSVHAPDCDGWKVYDNANPEPGFERYIAACDGSCVPRTLEGQTTNLAPPRMLHGSEQAEHRDTFRRGHAHGVADERVRVVQWLRDGAVSEYEPGPLRRLVQHIATSIEEGHPDGE